VLVGFLAEIFNDVDDPPRIHLEAQYIVVLTHDLFVVFSLLFPVVLHVVDLT
jgi:hypothetical protein